MAKEKLAFASIIHPNKYSETSAWLLASSIRTFGGMLSQSPIYFMVPRSDKLLSPEINAKLSSLNVKLFAFDISDEALQFPLASDVIATSVIENNLLGKIELLVWLGTNTVILQEPKHFLLSDHKKLGYRPVHHINIGSVYSKPVDKFWCLVYEYCKITPDRIFPMTTHIDEQVVRPYFNSGCLITGPQQQLFKKWHDTFFSIYQNIDLLELYKQDKRLAIFAHQAILSAIIIANYTKDNLFELPQNYNYPLHLYNEDRRKKRPTDINELITVRYESFEDLNFSSGLGVDDKFKKWIAGFLD